MKIMYCGTFPDTQSGYGRVSFELFSRIKKHLPNKEDILLYGTHPTSRLHYERRKFVDKHFTIENAVDQDEMDYGVRKLESMVRTYKPDVIFIYTDPWVTYHYTRIIRDIAKYKGRIISYLDICYRFNHSYLMTNIIKNVSDIILFTDFAKAELDFYAYSKPLHILNHGVNKKHFFNVDKLLAREKLSETQLNYNGQFDWRVELNDEDFIIFNGNRNQPRKRIDVTIKAYCCFLKNNGFPRAKLILNSINDSDHGWNYKELIHTVFYHKNQIKDYEQYFYFLTFPQSLEVHNLNLLYNACDIGINTGDSEGFGLVCFEQASVGVPQVVGNFGGLGDLFDDSCSVLVEPCGYIYHDATLDGVGGRGWCVSYEAVADGIGEYFNNERKRRLHGEACIKKFKDCHWEPLAEKLWEIIQ